MEVLKLNLPQNNRDKIFAWGTAFYYMGSALFPFAIGGVLDHYEQSWRWLFPLTALLSVSAILLKARIPIHLNAEDRQKTDPPLTELKQLLSKPWKSAWRVIQARPDFARYQLGFMLGGAGLIIMQPALPLFFMDRLHLSYTELAVALTLCKGIGYSATSNFWAQLINRIDIYRFNGWVTFLAFLFPFCLIAAQFNVGWIYFGYLLYGIMQAGSEMSWHLSGPMFAKEEDGSVYSSINVLCVGIRGCIFPACGTLLIGLIPVSLVMAAGSALCLISTGFMARFSRTKPAVSSF
jgi:MFS family permease